MRDNAVDKWSKGRLSGNYRIRRLMHWKLAPIGACVLALVSAVCANRALGQECPRASTTGASIPSQVQTLEGRLVFHDGIRQWLELELYKPQCGEKSIQ